MENMSRAQEIEYVETMIQELNKSINTASEFGDVAGVEAITNHMNMYRNRLAELQSQELTFDDKLQNLEMITGLEKNVIQMVQQQMQEHGVDSEWVLLDIINNGVATGALDSLYDGNSIQVFFNNNTIELLEAYNKLHQYDIGYVPLSVESIVCEVVDNITKRIAILIELIEP